MLTKLDGNQGGAVKRDEIDTRVRRGTDPNSLNYKSIRSLVYVSAMFCV